MIYNKRELLQLDKYKSAYQIIRAHKNGALYRIQDGIYTDKPREYDNFLSLWFVR